MTRILSAGILVRDQIDIYNPVSSFIRQTGIVPATVASTLFVNNSLVAWPLIDGTNVSDSSVSAGNLYFNEIVGSPGFYNLRFFPDQIGFWRLIMRIVMTSSEVIREYDIVPQLGAKNSGLNASFLPAHDQDSDRPGFPDRPGYYPR